MPGVDLSVDARHPETRPLANGSPLRLGLSGSERAGKGFCLGCRVVMMLDAGSFQRAPPFPEEATRP